MKAETIWALTLHQPWASLIAEGVKTEETRDWAPPRDVIGQRIAIHAGKRKMDRDALELLDKLDDEGPPLPMGAVVCTAKLVGAFQVEDHDNYDGVAIVCSVVGSLIGDWTETSQFPDEYGDWSIGRWIWCLDDIRMLRIPVPVRGYQKMWSLPEEVRGMVAVQTKDGV